MPLGNITDTMHTLITMNQQVDFIYDYCVNDSGFVLDTREFKKILEGVSFDVPEVSQYIKEFLKGNMEEVNGNIVL